MRRLRLPVLLERLETESVFAESNIIVKNTITRFHKKGFYVLMDDFGSGYSSLSVLSDLPISTIKLDQSFFKTTFTPRKKSLLDHIIQFLHANHFEIIAEGVEQEAMYQYCLNHHIPIIQGYYFYPALSVKEFNNLLENQKNA